MVFPTAESLFNRFRQKGDPEDLAAVFDCTAPRLMRGVFSFKAVCTKNTGP